jgi:sulfur carrier protein
MRVTILPQRKTLELSGRRRAGDLLRDLGLLPGTAMVIRGDELVLEHEILGAEDEIEVRSVISGGLE